jgi:hypothetical protein
LAFLFLSQNLNKREINMTDEERIAVRKYLPRPGFSIVMENPEQHRVLMQLLMGIGFIYTSRTRDALAFEPDYPLVLVSTEDNTIHRRRASVFQEISFDELLQLLEKATDEEIAKNAERDAALVSLKSLGLIKRPRI